MRSLVVLSSVPYASLSVRISVCRVSLFRYSVRLRLAVTHASHAILYHGVGAGAGLHRVVPRPSRSALAPFTFVSAPSFRVPHRCGSGTPEYTLGPPSVRSASVRRRCPPYSTPEYPSAPSPSSGRHAAQPGRDRRASRNGPPASPAVRAQEFPSAVSQPDVEYSRVPSYGPPPTDCRRVPCALARPSALSLGRPPEPAGRWASKSNVRKRLVEGSRRTLRG
jgi:hypothetical protein